MAGYNLPCSRTSWASPGIPLPEAVYVSAAMSRLGLRSALVLVLCRCAAQHSKQHKRAAARILYERAVAAPCARVVPAPRPCPRCVTVRAQRPVRWHSPDGFFARQGSWTRDLRVYLATPPIHSRPSWWTCAIHNRPRPAHPPAPASLPAASVDGRGSSPRTQPACGASRGHYKMNFDRSL